MIRFTALAVACLFSVSAFVQADDKKDGGKDDNAVVPLYRFLNKKKAEHLYTVVESEVLKWKEDEDMVDEGILGYANTNKVEDTTRLFRTLHKGGKHIFYLTKPAGLKDTSLEDIVMFVWTKPAEGRIPIHACILTNNTDLYMDKDLKRIQDAVNETKKGTGKERRLMKNYFYLQAEKK